MKIGTPSEDSTIDCSRCHRSNLVALVYWAPLGCAAVLHPGRIICRACRASIPVNTLFCPDCG